MLKNNILQKNIRAIQIARKEVFMDILNKKQKIILIIMAIFILLFIGGYIINKANKAVYTELETDSNEFESDIIEKEINDEKEDLEDKEIIIHVTGEVKRQGIVKVKQGDRISDVIDVAGGINDRTDLSKINLAYIVQDGQKIYVPSIHDKDDVDTIVENAGVNVIKDGTNSGNKEGKININKASQTELETLSGVGPSTALKIINYRNENGKFKTIDDIKNVPGIGEAKFENIKNDICV